MAGLSALCICTKSKIFLVIQEKLVHINLFQQADPCILRWNVDRVYLCRKIWLFPSIFLCHYVLALASIHVLSRNAIWVALRRSFLNEIAIQWEFITSLQVRLFWLILMIPLQKLLSFLLRGLVRVTLQQPEQLLAQRRLFNSRASSRTCGFSSFISAVLFRQKNLLFDLGEHLIYIINTQISHTVCLRSHRWWSSSSISY
jgi:hypothetical protein